MESGFQQAGGRKETTKEQGVRFHRLLFSQALLAAAIAYGQPQEAADSTDDGQPSATTVRVAAVSFVPEKFNLNRNADRLEKFFRQAWRGGAQLAVAPEGILEGYVVNEIISGEVDPQRMNDVALAIDDPLIRRFQELAAELEMCLVFGFAERVERDVYNCAIFIDHEGEICGKYHKMQLAEGYHASWWFNRLGRRSRAFETPWGRCGILICNDRWNPHLAKILALDGARFLIIPAYGSRSPQQDQAVLSRGRENNVPVVEANVGVSLIVDGGRITTCDRREEGLTFGQLTIPPPVPQRLEERDCAEQAFLEDREREMRRRYQQTMRRLRSRPHDSR
jgi:N-carbamoylputrescine amidase